MEQPRLELLSHLVNSISGSEHSQHCCRTLVAVSRKKKIHELDVAVCYICRHTDSTLS